MLDWERAIPAWRRTTPNEARRLGCGSAPGMDGIEGLAAGDAVMTEQMRALCSAAAAPVGRAAGSSCWRDRRLTERDYLDRDPVGCPVPDPSTAVVRPFRLEVARAHRGDHTTSAGYRRTGLDTRRRSGRGVRTRGALREFFTGRAWPWAG